MNPERAKKDSEQAAAIEHWDQARADLLIVDSQCELKDPFILTAFMQLLTPTFQDYIDKHLEPALRNNYEEIRRRVYAWVLKLKLDSKKEGPIHNIDPNNDFPGWCPPCSPEYNPYGGNYDQSWGGGYDNSGGDLQALGAGKGMFKGKNGTVSYTHLTLPTILLV